MAEPVVGGALSGAAQGAATGTAIMPGWGTLIGAGVGAIGGALSTSGTADAQSAQNKAAAQQAAAQSSQSWQNYLASRGINIQQLIAQFPDIQQSYEEAVARGDKRNFDAWVYEALKAAPNHPIWNAIANPAGTAAAANTTLPAWAVGPDGKPLQPEILQQLLAINSGANNPATAPASAIATPANVRAYLQANPQVVQQLTDAGVGSDGRPMEQWLADHITQTEAQSGGGTFTQGLRTFLATPPAGTPGAAGVAGVGSTTSLDPAITALLPRATETLGGVFDGTYLNQILAAQKPVEAARAAEVAAIAARTAEQRGLSGELLTKELMGIEDVTRAREAGAGYVFNAQTQAAQGVHDANISKLAELLGVRREAAQQIYAASISGAAGVRDARTTGAKDIYGAELLRADTYQQASEQALSRMLAQQGAERARRGFTGGSSGSNIVDARLTADYLQRGAGVRADAGVGYQGRLSDAGIGYATDAGKAGVGHATTLGASAEADAAAKLAAAVELAKSLGLAGTTRATTIAGTGEQESIARLQSQVADATRRLGYLTADTDIAKANADLKNAQEALAAITGDQNRKIGAIGAPFTVAGLDLGLKDKLTEQQYSGFDALIKRLGSFTTSPASGPTLMTTVPNPVYNTSQIIGAGLTDLGKGVSTGANSANDTKSFLEMIAKLFPSGNGKPTTYDDFLKSNPTSSAATGGFTSVFAPVGPG